MNTKSYNIISERRVGRYNIATFIIVGCCIGSRSFMCQSLMLQPSNHHFRSIHHSATNLFAKPKRGNVVESYQTVAVNCQSCKHRLFRYKKKNGTKSNLIKCYVERIVNDNPDDNVLAQQLENFTELSETDHKWCCPKCGVNFGRSSLIHGLPALKLVGGKTRMTKK